MEHGGGGGEETAAKCAKPSRGAAGDDRLNALSDDVLVLILLCLRIPEATRTSVLSRHVWLLLPELRFLATPDPHRIRTVHETREAALRYLFVRTLDASPESAGLVPTAASCLSDRLVIYNLEQESGSQEDEDAQGGAFELPCLGSATTVSLHLRFLGLALPPASVFARLTELCLDHVRLHGPCGLGDAVSSPR